MSAATHLDALHLRLSHERGRLAACRSAREREMRNVWIAGIEREIAHEIEFLGGTVDDDIAALSDDELLMALGASVGVEATT